MWFFIVLELFFVWIAIVRPIRNGSYYVPPSSNILREDDPKGFWLVVVFNIALAAFIAYEIAIRWWW